MMIEHNLFLRAVENGDTDTVTTYLSTKESNFEVFPIFDFHPVLMVMNIILSIWRRFKAGIDARFTSKNSITRLVWLKAVAIAQDKCHDEMLNLLFNVDRFIRGFNENGQTILHQIVAEYLSAEYGFRKIKTIEILMKSWKFSANISNLQNETIFEYVCKIEPKQWKKIHDLLRIFHENEIDLNARNKNGETLLMLACDNRRFDIVRSLLKVGAYGFVLDIDAVDNSGETSLMKAKQNNDSKIVAALLGKTIISLAEDKNEDAMLKYAHFLLGFNEDELTTFYEAMAECLEVKRFFTDMNEAKILLKSWKFSANVLNLQNETIFEMICKVNTEYYIKIDDLLQILLQNEIDLNGRNKNGETFLMLACKNKRIKLVRSLLDLASHGFVLDIDAVDNSGETAIMKAKEKDFYKIVVDLLKIKLISAVKYENIDVVKFLLAEFRNTLDIFKKSWSSNQDDDDMSVERETKSDILLEAMDIAMENDTKPSAEILTLILDCDIRLNQEIETCYYSFHRLMHGWKHDDDKKLRLFELLLISGNINANDRDDDGRTWLHLAEEEKLISLLIRYGADVNRKDNKGKTPLMSISIKYGRESFPVLRTLLEEAGTLVNLDAMDCNGQTVLMHAVMRRCSHHVEFLLNKGASVNLSDHLGFTALHHALHEDIDEHLNKFPQNSQELKKIKDLAILLDAEKHGSLWRNEEWSEERRKIVELLLQRPDIDVNSLSFEMFSPLDIVEGQISDLSSSNKDALKEKGAVLNVFRQTESQTTSDFHLDFTSMLTLTFKKLAKMVHNKCKTKEADFLIERYLTLIGTLKDHKVSGKDQQGRTALHLVAISFYDFWLKDNECTMESVNKIVDKLISLGCSVNAHDIFGRTPLHYANKALWKLFISKEADDSIKDKDGNIATEKTWHRHRSDEVSDIVRGVDDRIGEIYLLRLINNKQMEINVSRVGYSNDYIGCYVDGVNEFLSEPVNIEAAPRLLWEKREYAFCHSLVKQITEEVTDLMDAIVKEIERLDPRFGIRIEPVGSSNEGTKIDQPDEFDFCFVLTKFSELCEVFLSPELPTGFVRLKRKPIKASETNDFDSFFGKDGILNAEKLRCQFTTILHHALINVDSQLCFEWILKLDLRSGGIYKLKKVVTIEMMKRLNFYPVDTISIDIVPCIHVDGWWPDEAISNVSIEMKKLGCNFVFSGPQELYSWVPYSESCVRISFAKAESDMTKQSCDNAREAYMIGKTMTEQSPYDSDCKYALKNCLLYCIEALSPSSENASRLKLSLEELNSKFHQMDRYLWLKVLMKCYLEFVVQDFCPCYFLPTFSSCSLIYFIESKRLKNVSLDWISDHGLKFPRSCKKACARYRCTINDISECSYQLPAPDPLWERFDRKQLIASLCEIAYK